MKTLHIAGLIAIAAAGALVATAAVTAVVVASVGAIGFVGLIVPHFARALAGTARILPLLPLVSEGAQNIG